VVIYRFRSAGSAGRYGFTPFSYFNVPVIKPRLGKLVFALLTGVSVVVACSVDHADMAASTCNGLNCTPAAPPAAIQNVPGAASGAADAAAAPAEPPAKLTCGVGSCLPEDTNACSDYTQPGGPGDAGVALDAGPGTNLADGGGDGGAEGPAVDGSFTQPSRPSAGPPQFACQLSLADSGDIVRGCGVAGSQLAEQACTTSLDCAPGLGCVGPVRSGRCLPYCCGVDDANTCADGFYCAERPLRSEALGESDGPPVPVCVRADNCSLGEQKDCTGPRCVCGPDMACTLVRPDGTTSCVPLPPSPGQGGDSCARDRPCDRGLHCSQATSPATCVKTCDLDEKDSDTCGLGVCQAAAVLPAGWGICVAATPEQMR
jgi:hypothetical protein